MGKSAVTLPLVEIPADHLLAAEQGDEARSVGLERRALELGPAGGRRGRRLGLALRLRRSPGSRSRSVPPG